MVHIEDGVAVARDPPRQSAEDAADASVDELTDEAPTATAALAAAAPVDTSDSSAEPAPVAAPAVATAASSPAVSSPAATSAPIATTSTSIPNLGSTSTSNPKLGGREAKSDGDLASGLVSSYLRAMGPVLVTTYTLLLLCSYAAYLAGDLTLTAWMASLRQTNSSALELDAEMRSARRAESLRSLIIYVSSLIASLMASLMASLSASLIALLDHLRELLQRATSHVDSITEYMLIASLIR